MLQNPTPSIYESWNIEDAIVSDISATECKTDPKMCETALRNELNKIFEIDDCLVKSSSLNILNISVEATHDNDAVFSEVQDLMQYRLWLT